MSFQISLTSDSSEIIREYNDGVVLNGKYEVGLKHFVFWNTSYNITDDNNILILIDPIERPDTITNEMRKSKHEVKLPPGYYELDDIIDTLSNMYEMQESKTIIQLVKTTLKIKIKSHWIVDFTHPHSIGKVLGFSNKRVLEPNKYEVADGPANIFSINTVKIHCNLISTNIEDLKRNTHVLYDFPLYLDIGGKIIKEPNPICYFAVNTTVIYELVIRITDQDNKLLDLHREQINLTIDFRPCH